MSLHWLDQAVSIRRHTYASDKTSLTTIFTNVIGSVQQNDVPVGLGGGGYSSRTYTVFFDLGRTVYAGDRLITADGKELRVLGVKRVSSGSEDYQELSCEESQEN